jgi:hypothetical protein
MSQKKNEHKKDIKQFKRKAEDLELKKRLLFGPESFITEKASDEGLDRLSLKMKLFAETGFEVTNIVADVLADYESKFKIEWFYKLADLAGVKRNVMDVYVKPEFVRLFIIEFVYARFPNKILKTLRSKNRQTSTENRRTKLFQHLTKSASEQLDLVISQVEQVMNDSVNLIDFKMKYSNLYSVYFQTGMFQ